MEHLKRSAELCGWAVVYDGSAGGGRSLEMAFLLFEKSGIKESSSAVVYKANLWGNINTLAQPGSLRSALKGLTPLSNCLHF